MKKWILFISLLISIPLMSQVKILAFAGSTREDSYNKKLIKEAVEIARQKGAKVTLIDLKNYSMPFYDADLENREGIPSSAKLFRNLILENDAIMISSPEYNASIPAILKNAIDWASRTENGKLVQVFQGKRFAIMSASPSGGGGERGLTQIRAILKALHAEVLTSQVTVPNAQKVFNNKGELTDLAIKQQLQKEVSLLMDSLTAKK